jgi:hypothetical protein
MTWVAWELLRRKELQGGKPAHHVPPIIINQKEPAAGLEKRVARTHVRQIFIADMNEYAGSSVSGTSDPNLPGGTQTLKWDNTWSRTGREGNRDRYIGR